MNQNNEVDVIRAVLEQNKKIQSWTGRRLDIKLVSEIIHYTNSISGDNLRAFFILLTVMFVASRIGYKDLAEEIEKIEAGNV